MSRLALIDGDVLCYKCFGNRLDAQEITSLKDNPGSKIVKEWTKAEDAKYLRESWDKFEKLVESLLEETYCTDYLMAIQGAGNYRKEIFPDYKMHRGKYRSGDLSRFVPEIMKLAERSDYAIRSDGREADDMLRIWAEEARRAGRETVVISIDKDLLCIPGKHYNITKRVFTDVDDATACRLTYQQLLSGDPVDNIPGLPGMGPKGAIKALADFDTKEEFQEVVVGHYLAAYGDDWKQYLLANGKLLHIQRDVFDYFDLNDWPLVQELDS